MRTYIYDRINYRERETIAKLSLGFCSFDSSVDPMMLLPHTSKLVNSQWAPTQGPHLQPLSTYLLQDQPHPDAPNIDHCLYSDLLVRLNRDA